MLAPLLLLWPMSIFLTYLVAQNIANRPYRPRPRRGGARHRAAGQRRAGRRRGAPTVQPAHAADGAAELLRADDADSVYFQVLGPRGEFVAGDDGLPVPDEAGQPARRAAASATRRCATTPVRVAYMWVPLPVDLAESIMLPAGRPRRRA